MNTPELIEWLRAQADFIDADTYDECWEVKETPRGKMLRAAASRLSEMDAEIKRLREALLNTGAHNNPPCAICGYNGPNYYQPETHSCMAKARAALEHQP